MISSCIKDLKILSFYCLSGFKISKSWLPNRCKTGGQIALKI